MNNLGFSNDNLFIGDVRVKGEGETIIIGNENGGDGYILPTIKGTEGQVITMNADNSTSFQDASQGLTGRIIKNLFVMRERTSFYNTSPTSAQALYQTGYGSNDVLIGDFPVNSTIHIYSRGVISFDASVVASGTGVFQLEIDDGAGSVVYFASSNLTLSKQGTSNPNRFYQVDFIFQRTGTNTYRIDGYGLVSDSSSGQKKMGFVETSYSPTTPYTQFTIKATYYKIVSTPGEEYIPISQVYINNLILDSSLLIDPPPAPTSHTALTDLTAGDAGHTQFAQLNGRNGGQILSGGITPLHNLTLKSHDIGLPNLIVKDLNTSFEKDIDMNQKQINNCLVVNNQSGQPLNLIGGSNVSAVLLDATPTQGVIIGSDVGTSTEISGESQLDLSSNSGSINVIPSTFFNVIAGGLPRLGIDATQVNIGNPLNMNNNAIVNAPLIDSISSPLTLNCGLGNSITIDGSFITFFQGGGSFVPTFTSSAFDMNNGPINNVVSINGFTPAGGVFMGTSDGVVISATTTETTLLPSTFVGTLTIPPNAFQISSFHLVLAGSFASNNGDDLTIRLKSNGITLGNIVVPLNNSSASNYEVEVDFQIRSIGGPGVADILTNFDFTYNQSGGGGAFVGERNVTQNNTTFDTTITNTLVVTAQFSSASANNSIQTRVSKLSQTY